MDNITNIKYGVNDNENCRVLEVEDEKGEVNRINYDSIIDNWKESKMPHEFLYFEDGYMEFVQSAGKSKNVHLQYNVNKIPKNVMDKVIEEIKR